ncbi:hypothetical protein HT031_004631 [Scenedesmus sp. PABB004]|nr:hypothetical protein HT031_004631 [Scenedesmus sp. PABB004]
MTRPTPIVALLVALALRQCCASNQLPSGRALLQEEDDEAAGLGLAAAAPAGLPPACSVGAGTTALCAANCAVCDKSAPGVLRKDRPCLCCKAGYVPHPTRGGKCVPCALKRFSPTPGATKCLACRDGLTTLKRGSTSCDACPPGMEVRRLTQTANGATVRVPVCRPCAMGRASPGGAIALAPTSPLAPRCKACPTGRTTLARGAATCDACQLGHGGATCAECEANQFSAGGAATTTACQACEPGTTSLPGAAACESDVPLPSPAPSPSPTPPVVLVADLTVRASGPCNATLHDALVSATAAALGGTAEVKKTVCINDSARRRRPLAVPRATGGASYGMQVLSSGDPAPVLQTLNSQPFKDALQTTAAGLGADVTGIVATEPGTSPSPSPSPVASPSPTPTSPSPSPAPPTSPSPSPDSGGGGGGGWVPTCGNFNCAQGVPRPPTTAGSSAAECCHTCSSVSCPGASPRAGDVAKGRPGQRAALTCCAAAAAVRAQDACPASLCEGLPNRSPVPQLDAASDATKEICCVTPVVEQPVVNVGLQMTTCDAGAAVVMAASLQAQLTQGMTPEEAANIVVTPITPDTCGRRRMLSSVTSMFKITTLPGLSVQQNLEAAKALADALGISSQGVTVEEIVTEINQALQATSGDAETVAVAVAELVDVVNAAIEAANVELNTSGSAAAFVPVDSSTGASFVEVVHVHVCDYPPLFAGVSWSQKCAGYVEGDVCTGVCSTGYGTRTATCGVNGTWVEDSTTCPDPPAVLQPCTGQPNAVANAAWPTCANLDKCTAVCEANFKGGATSTCDKNSGQWSTPSGACTKITCPLPIPINATNAKWPSLCLNGVGATCNATCVGEGTPPGVRCTLVAGTDAAEWASTGLGDCTALYPAGATCTNAKPGASPAVRVACLSGTAQDPADVGLSIAGLTMSAARDACCIPLYAANTTCANASPAVSCTPVTAWTAKGNQTSIAIARLVPGSDAVRSTCCDAVFSTGATCGDRSGNGTANDALQCNTTTQPSWQAKASSSGTPISGKTAAEARGICCDALFAPGATCGNVTGPAAGGAPAYNCSTSLLPFPNGLRPTASVAGLTAAAAEAVCCAGYPAGATCGSDGASTPKAVSCKGTGRAFGLDVNATSIAGQTEGGAKDTCCTVVVRARRSSRPTRARVRTRTHLQLYGSGVTCGTSGIAALCGGPFTDVDAAASVTGLVVNGSDATALCCIARSTVVESVTSLLAGYDNITSTADYGRLPDKRWFTLYTQPQVAGTSLAPISRATFATLADGPPAPVPLDNAANSSYAPGPTLLSGAPTVGGAQLTRALRVTTNGSSNSVGDRIQLGIAFPGKDANDKPGLLGGLPFIDLMRNGGSIEWSWFKAPSLPAELNPTVSQFLQLLLVVPGQLPAARTSGPSVLLVLEPVYSKPTKSPQVPSNEWQVSRLTWAGAGSWVDGSVTPWCIEYVPGLANMSVGVSGSVNLAVTGPYLRRFNRTSPEGLPLATYYWDYTATNLPISSWLTGKGKAGGGGAIPGWPDNSTAPFVLLQNPDFINSAVVHEIRLVTNGPVSGYWGHVRASYPAVGGAPAKSWTWTFDNADALYPAGATCGDVGGGAFDCGANGRARAASTPLAGLTVGGAGSWGACCLAVFGAGTTCGTTSYALRPRCGAPDELYAVGDAAKAGVDLAGVASGAETADKCCVLASNVSLVVGASALVAYERDLSAANAAATIRDKTWQVLVRRSVAWAVDAVDGNVSVIQTATASQTLSSNAAAAITTLSILTSPFVNITSGITTSKPTRPGTTTAITKALRVATDGTAAGVGDEIHVALAFPGRRGFEGYAPGLFGGLKLSDFISGGTLRFANYRGNTGTKGAALGPSLQLTVAVPGALPGAVVGGPYVELRYDPARSVNATTWAASVNKWLTTTAHAPGAPGDAAPAWWIREHLGAAGALPAPAPDTLPAGARLFNEATADGPHQVLQWDRGTANYKPLAWWAANPGALPLQVLTPSFLAEAVIHDAPTAAEEDDEAAGLGLAAAAPAGLPPACSVGAGTTALCAANCAVCDKSAPGVLRKDRPCLCCKAGYVPHPTRGGKCVPCALKRFSPTPGATKCLACRDGLTTLKRGSTSCDACPPGMEVRRLTQTANGATVRVPVCRPCAMGRASPGGAIALAPTSPLAPRCKACPTGRTTLARGAATCDACQLGHGGATCAECEANQFSAGGAATTTACQACEPGTTSLPGAAACESDVPLPSPAPSPSPTPPVVLVADLTVRASGPCNATLHDALVSATAAALGGTAEVKKTVCINDSARRRRPLAVPRATGGASYGMQVLSSGDPAPVLQTLNSQPFKDALQTTAAGLGADVTGIVATEPGTSPSPSPSPVASPSPTPTSPSPSPAPPTSPSPSPDSGGGGGGGSPVPQLDAASDATKEICCVTPVVEQPVVNVGLQMTTCDAGAAVVMAASLQAQLTQGMTPEEAANIVVTPDTCNGTTGGRRLLSSVTYTFKITTLPGLSVQQNQEAATALADALGISSQGVTVEEIVTEINQALQATSGDAETVAVAVAELVDVVNAAIEAANVELNTSGSAAAFVPVDSSTGASFVEVVHVHVCDYPPLFAGVSWSQECAGYVEGDVCTGVCSTGYGTRTATCGVNGTWVEDSTTCPDPPAVLQPCTGQPNAVANAAWPTCANLDECTAVCEAIFKGGVTSTCDKKLGNWTTPSGACTKITCPLPIPINATNAKWPSLCLNGVGATCNATCVGEGTPPGVRCTLVAGTDAAEWASTGLGDCTALYPAGATCTNAKPGASPAVRVACLSGTAQDPADVGLSIAGLTMSAARDACCIPLYAANTTCANASPAVSCTPVTAWTAKGNQTSIAIARLVPGSDAVRSTCCDAVFSTGATCGDRSGNGTANDALQCNTTTQPSWQAKASSSGTPISGKTAAEARGICCDALFAPGATCGNVTGPAAGGAPAYNCSTSLLPFPNGLRPTASVAGLTAAAAEAVCCAGYPAGATCGSDGASTPKAVSCKGTGRAFGLDVNATSIAGQTEGGAKDTCCTVVVRARRSSRPTRARVRTRTHLQLYGSGVTCGTSGIAALCGGPFTDVDAAASVTGLVVNGSDATALCCIARSTVVESVTSLLAGYDNITSTADYGRLPDKRWFTLYTQPQVAGTSLAPISRATFATLADGPPAPVPLDNAANSSYAPGPTLLSGAPTVGGAQLTRALRVTTNGSSNSVGDRIQLGIAFPGKDANDKPGLLGGLPFIDLMRNGGSIEWSWFKAPSLPAELNPTVSQFLQLLLVVPGQLPAARTSGPSVLLVLEPVYSKPTKSPQVPSNEWQVSRLTWAGAGSWVDGSVTPWCIEYVPGLANMSVGVSGSVNLAVTGPYLRRFNRTSPEGLPLATYYWDYTATNLPISSWLTGKGKAGGGGAIPGWPDNSTAPFVLLQNPDFINSAVVHEIRLVTNGPVSGYWGHVRASYPAVGGAPAKSWTWTFDNADALYPAGATCGDVGGGAFDCGANGRARAASTPLAGLAVGGAGSWGACCLAVFGAGTTCGTTSYALRPRCGAPDELYAVGDAAKAGVDLAGVASGAETADKCCVLASNVSLVVGASALVAYERDLSAANAAATIRDKTWQVLVRRSVAWAVDAVDGNVSVIQTATASQTLSSNAAAAITTLSILTSPFVNITSGITTSKPTRPGTTTAITKALRVATDGTAAGVGDEIHVALAFPGRRGFEGYAPGLFGGLKLSDFISGGTLRFANYRGNTGTKGAALGPSLQLTVAVPGALPGAVVGGPYVELRYDPARSVNATTWAASVNKWLTTTAHAPGAPGDAAPAWWIREHLGAAGALPAPAPDTLPAGARLFNEATADGPHQVLQWDRGTANYKPLAWWAANPGALPLQVLTPSFLAEAVIHDVRVVSSGPQASFIGCAASSERALRGAPQLRAERGAAPRAREAMAAPPQARQGGAWDSPKMFLAGGAAGAVARTATAPLDRIKLLFQVQAVASSGTTADAYTGVGQAARKIFREEGFTAFWKGNGVNIIRIFPYSAGQLAANDTYKRLLANDHGELTVPRRLLAGACAGMTATALTHPLDTVRLRLALPGHNYNGAVDAARRMVTTEGAGSLYKGLAPTLVGIAPYAALNFATYDLLKSTVYHGEKPQSAVANLFMGGAAGTIAATACYPLDTIRRRMQMRGSTYTGQGHAFRAIWAGEGLRGFYRGWTANTIKVVPQNAIRLVTYEALKGVLGVKRSKTDT